jgi:hypothetical protein
VIALCVILAIALVVALGLMVFHALLNDEDGRKIALLELDNRDLARRNAELELKSDMDERLIHTLAKDNASGTAPRPAKVAGSPGADVIPVYPIKVHRS